MRKTTSLILVLAFILVSITGVQMTGGSGHAPVSTVQAQSADTAADAPKQLRPKSFYPKVAHEWGGYLFIIAGLTHLGLNLRPMRSYLRIKP